MSQKSVTLSQAIEGYTIHAYARRLSPNTVHSYEWAYHRLESVVGGDRSLASITARDIRAFIGSLSELSNKSVLNAHVALSALWTWAWGRGWSRRNIVRDVRPPKPEIRDVIAFGKRDVQAMLGACDRSKAYARPGKRSCDNKRPTALRDRAIVMLLLDTGIRAAELCGLAMQGCGSGQSPGGGDGQGQEGTAHPDLVADGAGAVALQGSAGRAQGWGSAVPVGAGDADGPEGVVQADQPARRAGGGGGRSPAPVQAHVCHQFLEERGQCVRAAEDPRARVAGDGEALPVAGADGPGEGAPGRQPGDELAAVARRAGSIEALY